MIKVLLEEAEAEMLQLAVEKHLDACYLSLECEEEDMCEEEKEMMKDFEPFDIFCGCPTCITRETIMKTFEFLSYIGKIDLKVKDNDK